MAEGGAEGFYRGPIARAIAGAVQEAGGWLTEADLAAFAPEWREPVSVTYRGAEVVSVPPPFSAFQMLETLNILEGFDLAAWGHNSTEYLHHLIEANLQHSVQHMDDVIRVYGVVAGAFRDILDRPTDRPATDGAAATTAA